MLLKRGMTCSFLSIVTSLYNRDPARGRRALHVLAQAASDDRSLERLRMANHTSYEMGTLQAEGGGIRGPALMSVRERGRGRCLLGGGERRGGGLTLNINQGRDARPNSPSLTPASAVHQFHMPPGVCSAEFDYR